MKKSIRTLYITYFTVLALTLCGFIIGVISVLSEPITQDNKMFGHGYGILLCCLLFVPLLIAEFEIFYCTKYFAAAQENKKSPTACVNIIFCVLSVAVPLFAMISLFLAGAVAEVSFVLLSSWMLIQPICRVICLITYAVRRALNLHRPVQKTDDFFS